MKKEEQNKKEEKKLSFQDKQKKEKDQQNAQNNVEFFFKLFELERRSFNELSRKLRREERDNKKLSNERKSVEDTYLRDRTTEFTKYPSDD